MILRPLGRSGLSIAPIVIGGNVFGWTADKQTSFDLLDRLVAGGLNAIDTANSYQTWIPGNTGISETIIGEWLASRRKRNDVVLITKVGSDIGQGRKDLSAPHILSAVEDSLKRLKTDRIDLYFSHWHDADTPYIETLAAYDSLIKAGKVRAIGASNHDAAQVRAAMDVARRHRLTRYEVLQPEYNLYDRAGFENDLRDLALDENLGVITYFALAKGFLSGKYRGAADLSKSPRGEGIGRYLTPRGDRILKALDEVSAARRVKPAEVALAWLAAQRGVTAPIASATTPEQADSLVKAAQLRLTAAEIAALTAASDETEG